VSLHCHLIQVEGLFLPDEIARFQH
jgi:hypothetical protein